MGKRSDFARIERDFYPTPPQAVVPLLAHLMPGTRFIEPCAGDGRLVEELSRHGHVLDHAADIEPRASYIFEMDARSTEYRPSAPSIFITNPPWDRKLLHPIIENLSSQAPTWLLFDADWIHTRQSAHLATRLRKIVSVGRVKWIEDSPLTGKDNCAWHLFTSEVSAPALFIGRAA